MLRGIAKVATSRQTGCWLSLVTLPIAAIMFLPLMVTAQDIATISFSQRIEATERVKNIVQTIVNDELKSHLQQGYTTPRINVQLTFDEPRLQANAARHHQEQTQQAQRNHAAVSDATKALIKDLTHPEVTANRQQVAARTQEMRFGRLNIDIDRSSFDIIAQTPRTSSVTPQISLLLSNPESTIKPFNFNPLDYLESLDIQISIPRVAKAEAENRIKDLIFDSLHLSAFRNASHDWITVTRLEPPQKLNALDWIDSLWSAENQTLGLLIAGIILGFFAVVASMMLARMLGKIASNLTELKPAEQSNESSTDDNVFEGSSTEALVIDAEETDSGNTDRRKHDASAATQALTSEMKNIRTQLEEIISDNEQLAAELVMDMFYEKHGLEDFRDLLSFAGYKVLKPAMARLPRKAIIELQTYIEDSREAEVNLLNGCEVAQRLYRDSVSKITSAASSTTDDIIQSFKSTLVGTEDEVIKNISENLDATQLSIILRNLSNERGNMLMRHLNGQQLKEACALLDTPIENEAKLISNIIETFNEAQSKVKDASQLQRRFILRLAKSSSISEESSIIELVPPGDVELRRSLMNVRFFVNDLVHIPEKNMKKIFDTIDLPTRAEILVAVDSTLRGRLENLYPESSKVREMLNYEVESLEADQTRVEIIRRKSDTLLELLTSKAKAAIIKDPTLFDTVIKNVTGDESEVMATDTESAA